MKDKHSDGTVCPAGTKSIPRGFAPCCEYFEGHVDACYFDVRYEWWPKAKCWFIAIPESAGGGGIKINYCPHCGSQLGPKGRAQEPRRKKSGRQS